MKAKEFLKYRSCALEIKINDLDYDWTHSIRIAGSEYAYRRDDDPVWEKEVIYFDIENSNMSWAVCRSDGNNSFQSGPKILKLDVSSKTDEERAAEKRAREIEAAKENLERLTGKTVIIND